MAKVTVRNTTEKPIYFDQPATRTQRFKEVQVVEGELVKQYVTDEYESVDKQPIAIGPSLETGKVSEEKIDEKRWKEIKKSPFVKRMLANGDLVEVAD